MRQSERVESAATPRTRHAKSNGTHTNGHRTQAKSSLKDVVKLGRGLPRKLRRDMEAHPEALLATVGGASFLAGAILGSRIGRAILTAVIPFGLQHLVESELGPRLWIYVEGLLNRADNSQGAA
jgi:hypothetical protein